LIDKIFISFAVFYEYFKVLEREIGMINSLEAATSQANTAI